jgi:hypothetical protein
VKIVKVYQLKSIPILVAIGVDRLVGPDHDKPDETFFRKA